MKQNDKKLSKEKTDIKINMYVHGQKTQKSRQKYYY